MEPDARSELLIRRYLLASVSEQDRVQVETRLMNDDDFFEQINLVEDELVEEYLDGRIIGTDRKGFEDIFLCAPERQHKLRFARALRIRADQFAKERQEDGAAVISRWYQRILTLFDVSRPVLVYTLASAMLILVGGGAWMLVQMSGLKGQIAGLLEQQRDRIAEGANLRTLYEKEQARADQMASLLRQEQEKRVPTQSAMVSQPWFTIAPGAQRSLQSAQSLEIPKGAMLVGLKLDLAENWKTTYKAVLLSEGEEILSRSNLKAAVSDKRITISFSVPTTDLPDGYCEIRLYDAGAKEILETYSFRIIKN